MNPMDVINEKFRFAKKYAAEKALNQFVTYIMKDPNKRVPQILNMAEKMTPVPSYKEMIRALHDRYDNDPWLAQRLEETYVHPNVLRNSVVNWVVGVALFGIPDRVKLIEEIGVHIPAFILVDPTSACNLKCTGCWAGKYAKTDTISFERMDRLCQESKDLLMYWMVISGGEPFCYPHLIDLAKKHQDMVFMIYTNGTLIDDEMADKIVEVGNISPVFSLEGWRDSTDARRGEGVYDKVMDAMDRLRERGVIFGSSVTTTRHNIDELYSEEFVDHMIEKGVAYQWGFHYIPVGRDADISLTVTPEQRLYLANRVTELRARKPILLADFWNDGEATGGCIAGGRQYIHINSKGEVEPCAFIHFAVDNINDKSLLEVLQNPLLAAYQKRQPFNENHLAPCPMIDNPEMLREIVKESGAHPTHPGAEAVLDGEIAKYFEESSAEWKKISQPLFDEREVRRQEHNKKMSAKA